jgi:hypothetical protein
VFWQNCQDPSGLKIFSWRNPSCLMKIHIFEIDSTKKNFFFFLNNCNIKVVFVIKDFWIELLKQKVCIDTSGNIILNSAEMGGKMSSKKPFLSEKSSGLVWHDCKVTLVGLNTSHEMFLFQSS